MSGAGEYGYGAQGLIRSFLPDGLKDSGKALLIAGPTGTGKSGLAMEAARELDGEIVSVDSCSVYKSFDIGSAKPDAKDRSEIPHHLLDIRLPTESYSAGDFFRDACQAVMGILARGKTPILCGGTMMYVNTLRSGINAIPAIPLEIHEAMIGLVKKEGAPAAHELLGIVDPDSARRLSRNDGQRLVRALEVYEATGRPLGDWVSDPSSVAPFEFVARYLVPADRHALSLTLRRRFARMVDIGLVEEVRGIVGKYGSEIRPLRSVGYRQVAEYVLGSSPLDDAIERGVVATRRLAKRQMTWIRKFSPEKDEIVPV